MALAVAVTQTAFWAAAALAFETFPVVGGSAVTFPASESSRTHWPGRTVQGEALVHEGVGDVRPEDAGEGPLATAVCPVVLLNWTIP